METDGSYFVLRFVSTHPDTEMQPFAGLEGQELRNEHTHIYLLLQSLLVFS
jgi:hypothetical protein